MKSFRTLLAGCTLMAALGLSLSVRATEPVEVNTIDRRAAQSYRNNEVIVKFKPAALVRMQQKGKRMLSGVSQVDRVLNQLGVTHGEQLMPLTGSQVSNGKNKLRSVDGTELTDTDMSQLYRFQFEEGSQSVHEAVETLQSLNEVEFAEPNYVVYAMSADNEALANHHDYEHYVQEPLYAEQWGHHPLKMPFLWQLPKLSAKRPVIAIIDTGVDIEHPDLKDNIWTNEAEANGVEGGDDDANGFADDVHGWDFVNQTARMGDWNGHGTHCAGIAAAVGNNGIGITGANPDALIMPITVMQSDGTGDVATIIKGIDYAAANGADVISMSLGGYNYSIAEERALAKAYNKAVLVAAAGNDYKCIYAHDCPVNGKNARENGPSYPAAFTFVLGVEASAPNGGLASFSNFDEDGPMFSAYGEEQLYNYELRAPGASIMSTFPGGKYKKLNGTSMACPFVAGGISRLLQCKEYSSWEVLYGDLIHTRKLNGNGDVDFEAAYRLSDADREPMLQCVTYALKDTIEGDGDGKPDAGEVIAFYPTLRNMWGQAQNIRFSLALHEAEDPTIVEFLDSVADFGAPLSSYAKNLSAHPLRFKVNPACADGRRIRMVLRATCDNIAEELVHEFTLTAENGVEIGGMITENTTLYPNVHYIVTKPLAVPAGVTLTILPGTVLKFKEGTGLSVAKGANLVAKGEPGNMIVFTQDDLSYSIDRFVGGSYSYCEFKGLSSNSSYGLLYTVDTVSNCIIRDCYIENILFYYPLKSSCIQSVIEGNRLWKLTDPINIINSCKESFQYNHITNNYGRFNDYNVALCAYMDGGYNNVFNNPQPDGRPNNFHSNEGTPSITSIPQYWGSNREDLIRPGIWDINTGHGFLHYDLSTRLDRPSPLTHGIVWKVVVNGVDAQDEFEQLPPLGVGKHKFEVFFNRPMDVSVAPMLTMGVRAPYTQKTINEEGSWSADSLVYTAYLTIDGKTNTDGLNRIYVAEARDNEYFEIPVENSRFHVQVAAAGSMATGLMAEPGLGKVTLTWETDEEDYEDLLGYNLYRYTMSDAGVSSDSIIVNPSVLEAEESTFTDYDVVPGTTYYYVIKQLTTSLSSHALSNAVTATPLTAQKGDANGSMTVDIADVVTEVAYITYQDPQPFIFEAADVNNDSQVNVLDVVGTIGLIAKPAAIEANSLNDEPVRYSVENGTLYVETPHVLGGVQVRLNVDKDTELKTLEALNGMEQTGVWTADDEYLFLSYSMSGRSIPVGKHALMYIGTEAMVKEMVFSDVKGRNLLPVNDNATGIGKVEAIQLNIPSPNPFSTHLNVPYTIAKEGQFEVNIVVNDLSGRVLHSHRTTAGKGTHQYVWRPEGIQNGVYMVSLYADGTLMQTAKVICHK